MIALIKRFGPALLALFAGALALLPAVIWGVPNNNDLSNHYHFALPFYEAIQRGDLHPGWLASPNFGYGDTVVRFYPPALYYLLAKQLSSPSSGPARHCCFHWRLRKSFVTTDACAISRDLRLRTRC